MKKLALAAGVVVVVLLGVPWVFGALAQNRLAAGVERLDAEGQLEAEVVDYTRGWGTSTTTVELRVPQAAIDQALLAEDTPPQLMALIALMADPVRLEVAMRHGPLLVGDGALLGIAASTISLAPATPGYQELLAELDIPYLFEIRSITGFSGQSDFVADVPAFEYADGDLTIGFSGSNAAGTYDAGERRFEAQGEAASLRVAVPDAAFDVAQITFNSDSTRYNDLLRLGQVEATVGRINVVAPGERFQLDDLGVRFDIDLEDGGEHATMTGTYRFASFSDGDELDLTGLELVATASRIDVDALSAYYVAAQGAGIQNDVAAPLSLELEDAFYDLLVSSPVIDLAPVRVNWNGEPLNATARIAVDGANLPGRTNFTALGLALNGVISIEATLELSAALANMIATRGMEFQVRRGAAQDRVPMTDDEIQTIANSQAAIALAALVAQGMITSTADGYSTNARFADGELSVNGNVIPLGF
jgi:uncharacterized protein YdgA (DUF945 family)